MFKRTHCLPSLKWYFRECCNYVFSSESPSKFACWEVDLFREEETIEPVLRSIGNCGKQILRAGLGFL